MHEKGGKCAWAGMGWAASLLAVCPQRCMRWLLRLCLPCMRAHLLGELVLDRLQLSWIRKQVAPQLRREVGRRYDDAHVSFLTLGAPTYLANALPQLEQPLGDGKSERAEAHAPQGCQDSHASCPRDHAATMNCS